VTIRGLCGGVNAVIIRETRDYLLSQDRSKFSLFVIGDKGTSGLIRNFPEIIIGAINEVALPTNYYV
jgi:F0F1-type ATP synthase gamma subunit